MGSLAGVACPVYSSPDGWCHHLFPVGEEGDLDDEDGGTVNGESLAGGAGCRVAVGREAGGMLPVRSFRGYNNTL